MSRRLGRWTPLSGTERSALFAFAALGLAAIGIAAYLNPDGRGHGTHEKLGLPPCMMMQLLDIPCPFCGMTTSFAHMADREPIKAIDSQPVGALGFAAVVIFALGAPVLAAIGRVPAVLRGEQVIRGVLVGILAGILSGWIFMLIKRLYL